MTEPEWLACEDPQAMLSFLTDRGTSEILGGTPFPTQPSDRKLRLFACASWSINAARRRENKSSLLAAIRDAELFADGKMRRLPVRSETVLSKSAWEAALCAVDHACVECFGGIASPAEMADILRDIVGNPFRSLTVRPEWFTPDVKRLAQAAYEDRPTEDGTLDPARLLVLSDALEEAGCDEVPCRNCGGAGRIWVDHPPVEPHWNGCIDCDCTGYDPQSILGHLRIGYHPHYRGCHVLDLILGKE